MHNILSTIGVSSIVRAKEDMTLKKPIKKGQHIWYFREVGKKLNNHLVLEITLSLWHEKITDTKYKCPLSTKKNI